MFTTEREASIKRCTPIAAAIITLPETTERNKALLMQGNGCIGAACMQWRWRTPEPGARGNEFPNGDRKGYCGLAGSPPVTL